jgi:hypothetical protein
LELEDYDPLREELKFWKGQLLSGNQVPPLLVDVLLDITNLPSTLNLVLTSHISGRRHRIRPEALMGMDQNGTPIKKQKILLETWQLTLSYEKM